MQAPEANWSPMQIGRCDSRRGRINHGHALQCCQQRPCCTRSAKVSWWQGQGQAADGIRHPASQGCALAACMIAPVTAEPQSVRARQLRRARWRKREHAAQLPRSRSRTRRRGMSLRRAIIITLPNPNPKVARGAARASMLRSRQVRAAGHTGAVCPRGGSWSSPTLTLTMDMARGAGHRYCVHKYIYGVPRGCKWVGNQSSYDVCWASNDRH